LSKLYLLGGRSREPDEYAWRVLHAPALAGAVVRSWQLVRNPIFIGIGLEVDSSHPSVALVAVIAYSDPLRSRTQKLCLR